jgi:hypothetical protein
LYGNFPLVVIIKNAKKFNVGEPDSKQSPTFKFSYKYIQHTRQCEGVY